MGVGGQLSFSWQSFIDATASITEPGLCQPPLEEEQPHWTSENSTILLGFCQPTPALGVSGEWGPRQECQGGGGVSHSDRDIQNDAKLMSTVCRVRSYWQMKMILAASG